MRQVIGGGGFGFWKICGLKNVSQQVARTFSNVGARVNFPLSVFVRRPESCASSPAGSIGEFPARPAVGETVEIRTVSGADEALGNLTVPTGAHGSLGSLPISGAACGRCNLTGVAWSNPKYAMKTVHPAKIISIAIARSPASVYAFAANAANLPKWASGLSGATIKRVGGSWLADSPMGKVKIKFAAKNSFGILDHEVTTQDGTTFYNPMRVQPNGEGSEVTFTLYRLPKVSAKAYAKDAKAIRRDLAQLK